MVFLGALGSGHAWIFNGVLAASLHPKPFESRAGTFCYLGFTIFGILWGMFAGIRNHDDQPGLINAVLIPTATSAIFLSAAHLIKGLWTRKGWSPTSLAIGTATVGFSLGCLWLLRLAGDREKAPTG